MNRFHNLPKVSEVIELLNDYKGKHYSVMAKDERAVKGCINVDFNNPDYDNRAYVSANDFWAYGADLDENGIVLGYNGERY